MLRRIIKSHLFYPPSQKSMGLLMGFRICLLFLVLTSLMTYPLIFKITTHIPGFFSTDESYGVLWDSWRIKYSFKNHLSLAETDFTAYPFVRRIYTGGYFSTSWLALHHILSILTSPAITYNIQVFANLFLSAFFVYLLLFYLTKEYLCAILSGIIFAFCPYQFARIWQHLGLSYNQWLPFVILGLIFLKESRTKKSAFIFFLSIFLTFSFDWCIMFFCSIILACFIFFNVLGIFRKKFLNSQNSYFEPDMVFLKRVFKIGMLTFIILSPQFLYLILSKINAPSNSQPSAFNPYNRPFEDLFSQSARPLSYFLPASVHPLFGRFTESLVGNFIYGESFTEHALYLGWVALALAFVAFKRYRKSRRRLSTISRDILRERDEYYISFFIFLSIVGWFFSQPPWWNIFGLKIYMPSFFMYKILPMFRAYCRFGIVVMLSIAVLAGYGLKFIIEKFKTKKMKITITAILCGLALFEFLNYPPFKIIDISKVPIVYYWMKEQPKGCVIAEYPLDASSPNELYKFYQVIHEKKIINCTFPGTYANKVAQTITKLSSPNTASILRWMGVKYAIVHKDEYFKTEIVDDREELNKIRYNSGLRFLETFPAQECLQKDIICVQKTGKIDVYEVIAKSLEPKIN